MMAAEGTGQRQKLILEEQELIGAMPKAVQVSVAVPEEYFRIPPEAPREMNVDALLVALTRAHAVVALLEGDGADLKEGFNLNHALIIEAIGCIGGLIAQSIKIAEFPVGVK